MEIQDVYKVIKNAIINKEQLVIMYHGAKRHICPHTLGTRDNTLRVVAYQFDGYSSKFLNYDGSPDNWRTFFLSDIVDIEVKIGPWHTADNHSIPQNGIDNIDIEVDY